jgi:hypothetical protein
MPFGIGTSRRALAAQFTQERRQAMQDSVRGKEG